MILNLCFYAPTESNIAEHVIQPVDYFDFGLPVKKMSLTLPVDAYPLEAASAIIIGGSGIYGQQTWRRLREVVDRAPRATPIAIWGMGINDHDRMDRNYPDTLTYLESRDNVIIGLRDWYYKHHVPCPSCMRPEFDAKFSVQFEVGFYAHSRFNLDGASGAARQWPKMSNRVNGNPLSHFWRVLKFLGSCEVVVTNSYHGAYWATLLNRRVVVIAPFSNKFFGFKHEPIMARDIKAGETVTQLARRYPEALAEYRNSNVHFYHEVLSLQHSLQVATNSAERRANMLTPDSA